MFFFFLKKHVFFLKLDHFNYQKILCCCEKQWFGLKHQRHFFLHPGLLQSSSPVFWTSRRWSISECWAPNCRLVIDHRLFCQIILQLQAVTVLNLVFAAVRRCRWRTWGGSRCVWTSTTRWCRPAASPARRETLWWTTPGAPRPLNTSPSCTTVRWAARTHLGYLFSCVLQILLNSSSSLAWSTLV